jgi:leucyl/phenylalanyl-tRNA---protein transferase
MNLHVLTDNLWFPPVQDALEDGLLAVGGNVTPEKIVLAYSKGIFPWYDDELPMWWSPNPRFVLFPENIVVSKSMQQLLKKKAFTVTTNTCFTQVMEACQQTPRKNQDGTWIKPEIIAAYTALHKKGLAVSVECWQNKQLVGGLYGVQLGNIFFGESMFSHVSNASKFAFIHYVKQLQQQGCILIDCQVYTEHLESLGAQLIMREQFVHLLEQTLSSEFIQSCIASVENRGA